MPGVRRPRRNVDRAVLRMPRHRRLALPPCRPRHPARARGRRRNLPLPAQQTRGRIRARRSPRGHSPRRVAARRNSESLESRAVKVHVDFVAVLFIVWGALTTLIGLSMLLLGIGAAAIISTSSRAGGPQVAASLTAAAFTTLAIIALMWGA